jgi:putative addiction module killer protein
VIEIVRSEVFATWLRKLRDRQARIRITARLDRVADGNFGDVRSVGGGVQEMRIHSGPGYRIYFIQKGEVLIVLLCAGDKDSQDDDIRRAHRLAAEYED